MNVIQIRKIRSEGKEHYAVPCMALSTPQGRLLIPNPHGTETRIFNSLEEAGEAVHRAGFDYLFEGETAHMPVPLHQSRPIPRIGGQVNLADSIPRLTELLKDKEPLVITNAAMALGNLQAVTALDALSACFGHDDSTVRKTAAEAIAKMGSPALPVLREALGKGRVVTHSNAVYIRTSALMAYVEMLERGLHSNLMQQFLPQVMECLNDESWLVRAQAAQVLGLAANKQNTQD